MAENKKSFIIYTSWKLWLDGLSNEQKGIWLNWMMDYCNDLNPPYPKDQAIKIACMMAQDTLKRDLKLWEEQKQKRSEAGKLGMQKRWHNNDNKDNNNITNDNNVISDITKITDNVNVNVNVNDNVINNKENNTTNNSSVKEKPTTSRFYPPTLDEIRDYCNERRNLVDPDRFYDFYQAKGWMVGKNKMKDWKAAIRTWEKEAGFKKEESNPFQELGESDEDYQRRLLEANGGFTEI